MQNAQNQGPDKVVFYRRICAAAVSTEHDAKALKSFALARFGKVLVSSAETPTISTHDADSAFEEEGRGCGGSEGRSMGRGRSARGNDSPVSEAAVTGSNAAAATACYCCAFVVCWRHACSRVAGAVKVPRTMRKHSSEPSCALHTHCPRPLGDAGTLVACKQGTALIF